MLKRQYVESLRAALETLGTEIEWILFDGKSAGLADVLDELRSFSLMQRHKLVVVDEADRFVSAHRQALERYAQTPAEQATLVLRCERWNRGKLDQKIEKVGCLIKCDGLTAAQAKSWLIDRAQAFHQIKLSPTTASKMINRIGSDLSTLDSELSKLALFVEPGGTIDPHVVDKLTGKTSEEKAWAVQEAILRCLAGTGAGRKNRIGQQDLADGAVGEAIEKIHELVHLSGEAEVFVAYCLADLIRKLCLAKILRNNRVPDRQITRQLRLWGASQSTFFTTLERLDSRATDGLLDKIIRYDVRAKSGFGNVVRNLECFCAELPGLSDNIY